MARRHHYRLRNKQPMELEVTTFLNLMVVLVPFLLITAVFSRITIVELTLPSSTGGAASETPAFRVEVIVREEGLEISNGTAVIAAIPNVEEEYDFDTLSQYMVSLKQDNPDLEAASVLLERDIPYDYLIQTMDVARSAEVPAEDGSEEPIRIALFPNISIGEAP
ncbi:MAG: biopolymer transporter ExbD [Gammaproteobacteria bacterium]|nr:biopolymer transporter ExbD [Gammaproteobacteria bacterium]